MTKPPGTRHEEPAPTAYDRALRAREKSDWRSAHEVLAAADARGELDAGGLELFAESARWTGRNDLTVALLERAHAAWTRERDTVGAARTALTLHEANCDQGHSAAAGTWFHRADELLAGLAESREHALFAWIRARASGAEGATDDQRRHATDALAIALRHGDRSVEALALVEIGHTAAVSGAHEEAFAAIERATAIASSGEAGLYATGEVFCNSIWLFRCCGEWDRAHQWTEFATRWVERQQIEYFPALCRVHRSEILRVRGRLAEAEREGEIAAALMQRSIPGIAVIAYAELGEVRRRRGDLDGAMTMFERALEHGWNPQPGLALTLLARGETVAAFSAIERALAGPQSTVMFEDRASLQLARARIALAANRLDATDEAVATLEKLALANPGPWTEGAFGEARGRLALARGKRAEALAALSEARRAWSDLDAPYELASTCLVLGAVLFEAGDVASARIEFTTARSVFKRIGAEHDAREAQRRLDGIENKSANAPAETVPPRAPAAANDAIVEVRMRCDGDYWTIGRRERELRLKNTRGIEQLAILLAAPNEPRWALELAADPHDGASARAPDGGDGGELLDGDARAAYQARARELAAELEDARANQDEGRSEAIRTEMEALGRELSAAVGLGGRARRAASSTERARQSVTKAIRAVMRRIAELDPEIGDHLERSVRTGTSCVFDAGSNPRFVWRVVFRP